MNAGFRTEKVRRIAWLLLFNILFIHATAQDVAKISYDGYSARNYLIYFTDIGQRDGGLKLLLYANDENGHSVEEWLRPNDTFLGLSVSLKNENGQPVVFLCPIGKVKALGTSLSLQERTDFYIFSGVFGKQGYLPVIAYIGDTVSLGDTSMTLRNLSSTEATVHLDSENVDRTLPLSAIGSLRSEMDVMSQRVFHLNRSLARLRRDSDSTIEVLFITIIFGYILIYGFILVGMLTLPPFVAGRSRRRRFRHD